MLRFGVLLLAGTVAARAQAPMPWSWWELPAANATVLAVRWHGGFDLDAPGEAGACRVLAECRLQRARAAVPAVRGSGVRVSHVDSIGFVLVDAGDWSAAQRFVEHLLDDTLPLGDDPIDLAIARAALEADDAEWLYPGQVLASVARAELFAGSAAAHGVAGDAAAIQRLTPARVRELLRVPTAVQGLGLGHLPPALQSALAGRFPVGVAGPVPAMVVAPTADRPMVVRPHARPKAPFVAVGLPVPPTVDRRMLAIGLQIARTRAAAALPPSQEELLARAPRVQWSWIDADPVVLFCLRAPNGGSVASARAALERLLAGLRDVAPSEGECAAAAAALQAELGLPPWTDEQQAALAMVPGALPGKAIAWLSAGARGIDATAVLGVDPAAVQRALQATLVAGTGCWAAVVPSAPVPSPATVRRR